MPATPITTEQAHQLAVRYHAFQVAVAASNDNGMIVWGGMLLEIQRETGVELCEPRNAAALISGARRRLNLETEALSA